MNIDLTRLNNDIDKSIDVNIDYTFNKDELAGTDLLECDTHVIGTIYKNSLKQIVLDLSVQGDMIIPCAITLKPTKYPYKTDIKGSLIEFLNENDDFFTRFRYTATSKVTPYQLSSLPTIISNDFDPNTGKGVIKFTTDVTRIGN